MTERRQHFRRRTCLSGRIEIAKLNGWTLDCTVRNLSDGGARLAIPDGVVVPETVSLAISDRPRRPAKLVWYAAGQAGFRLVDQRGDEPRPFAGACRRARLTGVETGTEVDTHDRLASRIAAIAGRPVIAQPATHFTRP